MHKPLATPVQVKTPYGMVTCTHESFGVSVMQKWNDLTVLVRVVGFEDEPGHFTAVHAPEHERTVSIDAHHPELATMYSEIERLIALADAEAKA